MGEIDKEKEVIIIYVDKSIYPMGKLKISGLDYWELTYRCYIPKMLLGYESLFKKGLFRKKPKTEVLNASYPIYLIVK